MQRVESVNDRHEAAILILTVVTVIFLPLSFMSSIFGMNTADIRNMSKGQKVFWISAIPVTTAVIGLSLFTYRHFRPTLEAIDHFLHLKGFGKQGVDEFQEFVDTSHGQREQQHQAPHSNVAVQPTGNVPTYTRVHRKHVCPETLDLYGLPWEIDDVSNSKLTRLHSDC